MAEVHRSRQQQQQRYLPILPRMPASNGMFIGPLPPHLVYALASNGMLAQPLSDLVALPASSVLPATACVFAAARSTQEAPDTGAVLTQAGTTVSALTEACGRQQPAVKRSEASSQRSQLATCDAQAMSPLAVDAGGPAMSNAPYAMPLSDLLSTENAGRISYEQLEADTPIALNAGFEELLKTLGNFPMQQTELTTSLFATPTKQSDNSFNGCFSPLSPFKFSVDSADSSFTCLRHEVESGLLSPLRNLENLSPDTTSMASANEMPEAMLDRLLKSRYLSPVGMPAAQKQVNGAASVGALASTPERPCHARKMSGSLRGFRD